MAGAASRGERERSPRPERARLWATVLADLRARLAADEFVDRFPTDRELTAHYGVSRHTVREAVRRLGVVERRPRLGGQVRPVGGVAGNLVATLRTLGVTLTLEARPPSRRRARAVAEQVGLPAGLPLEVEEQVLLADRLPLLLSELWLTPGAPLAVRDVGVLLGLDPPAATAPGIRDQRTLPLAPGPGVCATLGIPAGSAVFGLEALIETGGQAVAWHRVYIRPDRYPCVLQFAPGGPV